MVSLKRLENYESCHLRLLEQEIFGLHTAEFDMILFYFDMHFFLQFKDILLVLITIFLNKLVLLKVLSVVLFLVVNFCYRYVMFSIFTLSIYIMI